jgi:hypothetical protein
MLIFFDIHNFNFTFPNSAPAMAVNPLTVKIANDFSLKTAIEEIETSSEFSLLSKLKKKLVHV